MKVNSGIKERCPYCHTISDTSENMFEPIKFNEHPVIEIWNKIITFLRCKCSIYLFDWWAHESSAYYILECKDCKNLLILRDPRELIYKINWKEFDKELAEETGRLKHEQKKLG
jgi:hypothetical protein